jgi:hypothetical protein
MQFEIFRWNMLSNGLAGRWRQLAIILCVAVGIWAGGAARGDAQGATVDALSDRDAAEPWSEGIALKQRRAAREVFLQGNRLLDTPLYAQAAAKYKEALALWPHPAIYYNLAIAQINLVQPLPAHASLQRAMEYGAGPLGDSEYAWAQEYLERLRSQLGRVEIGCDEPGARVTLDGKDLFIAPGQYAGVVEPGGHEVVARKPGRIPATEQLVLSPGQRVEVALRLASPDRIETARYMPAWVPWASMGVGAVLVGVGGYFDSRGSDERSVFDSDVTVRCPRGCETEGVPDLVERRTAITGDKRVATGFYIAGGLAVVGSALMIYANRERVVRLDPGGAVPAVAPASGIAVAPIVGAHGAGITLRSRF